MVRSEPTLGTAAQVAIDQASDSLSGSSATCSRSGQVSQGAVSNSVSGGIGYLRGVNGA